MCYRDRRSNIFCISNKEMKDVFQMMASSMCSLLLCIVMLNLCAAPDVLVWSVSFKDQSNTFLVILDKTDSVCWEQCLKSDQRRKPLA